MAWHGLVEEEEADDPHEDEKDGSEDGAALREEEVGDPDKGGGSLGEDETNGNEGEVECNE